jgi:hypothetical protein
MKKRSCPTIRHDTVNNEQNTANSSESLKLQTAATCNSKGKRVRYTFCCDFSSKLQENPIPSHLCFVTMELSVCPGMLTDKKEFVGGGGGTGGVKGQLAACSSGTYKGQSQLQLLFSLSKQAVRAFFFPQTHCDWSSVPTKGVHRYRAHVAGPINCLHWRLILVGR